MSTREAKKFARRAKKDPYRTYWVLHRMSGNAPTVEDKYLMPVEFTSLHFLDGEPMWGPMSASALWDSYGPVYDDRDHPDIKGVMTYAEMNRRDREYAEKFLGSTEWNSQLDGAADQTAFRSRRLR